MAFSAQTLVNVGINMVLRDQFSQNAGRVTDAFKNMMNNLSAAGRAVQASYGEAFDWAMSASKTVFDSYKAYAGVEKDIFLTGKMAGATKQQIAELRDLAEKTNLEVPLTTGDIASAEKFLAMAGNSTEKIRNLIPPVTQLASLFSMPAGGKGGVADLMTNIMSMYQIDTSQAETIANDLYVATTSANMSLTDLAESIKYAGAEMATMGYGVQETAAAIGLLGDMGIQGSSAGTALANTMRYLRKSLSGSKESGAKALARLGLSEKDFIDSKGELVDLYQVYKTLAKAVEDKGISGYEAGNLINDIVGVRGARNLMAVIKQLNSGEDTYSKIMKGYQDRQGALQESMQEYMQSPQGQLDMFKSTLDAIQQRLGSLASSFLTPLMQSVNGILGMLYEATKIPFVGVMLKGGLIALFISPLIVGARMINALIATMRQTIIMTQAALNRMQWTAKQMAAHQAAVSKMMAEAALLQPGQRRYVDQNSWFGKHSSKGVYLSYIDPVTRTRKQTFSQNTQQSLLMAAGVKGAGQQNTFGKWMGGTSKLARVGGGLMRGLGAVSGLLGGPIGIALTAGVFLLPKLIDVISGNTKANEDNARAQREKLRNMSAQEFTTYREKAFVEALNKAFNKDKKKPVGQVNININGNPYATAESGQYVTVNDLQNLAPMFVS